MDHPQSGADADVPAGRPRPGSGYQAYLASLGSSRDRPAALILTHCEAALHRVVRACAAVLGPVYHLADWDHAAIREAAARLENCGPVVAIARDRVLVTAAGASCGCPFCATFATPAIAGWRQGLCPVLAGSEPDFGVLPPNSVVTAIHVLIEQVGEHCTHRGDAARRGFRIDLPAGSSADYSAIKGGADLIPLAMC